MPDDETAPQIVTSAHVQNDVATRAQQAAAIVTLQTLCTRYVQHVLDIYRGNKTHAARALGIDRRSLYRWLAKNEAA